MKKYFLFVVIAAFIISGCKKDSPKTEPTTPEAPVTSVTISGDDYAVVKIGKRYWTNANYTGPGGVTNPAISNMTNAGKFYTLAQAKAITLPQGWRLPTTQDYVQLIIDAGGTPNNGEFKYTNEVGLNLKDKISWMMLPGNGSSSFNAVSAGVYDDDLKSFILWSNGAFFFTSSTQAIGIPSVNAPVYFAITDSEDLTTHEKITIIRVNGLNTPAGNKASVRFVRDL